MKKFIDELSNQYSKVAFVVDGALDIKIPGLVCYLEGGEDIKTFLQLEKLLTWMQETQLSRHDCLCVIGGGTLGDLAGFAASIYKRGIDWCYVPTTLLAQVDASVGGKTGINFGGAKNQVGTFWPPKNVRIFPEFVRTLPMRQRISGYIEIVKIAIIASPTLLKKLEKTAFLHEPCQEIINEAIALKQQIIGQDLREAGARQLLNFGHTFGHALEAQRDLDLTHGEAVGVGMVWAARLAQTLYKRGENVESWLLQHFYDINVLKPLEKLIDDSYFRHRTIDFIQHDKKIKGEKVNFILPFDVGDVRVVSIDLCDLALFLKDC